MVLSESLFEWFYDAGFPPHTQLANISGGTDLAACFGLENPLSPLYVGGCQGPSLGIPISAFDQADEGASAVKGTPVPDGTPGELVATAAFPTMPVKLIGEDGPQKYFDAYFARFDSTHPHHPPHQDPKLTQHPRRLDARRLHQRAPSNPPNHLPRPLRRRAQPVRHPLRIQ